MVACDLCVENRKVFAQEFELFSQKDLRVHERDGDTDGGPFKGHPLCEFCNQRMYDDNALWSHLRKSHYTCHLCERHRGVTNEFLNTYDDLEAHFRSLHFLCEDDGCLAQKFVVFNSEVELQAHCGQVHMTNAPRRTRQVALPVQWTLTRRPEQDARAHASTLPRSGSRERELEERRARGERDPSPPAARGGWAAGPGGGGPGPGGRWAAAAGSGPGAFDATVEDFPGLPTLAKGKRGRGRGGATAGGGRAAGSVNGGSRAGSVNGGSRFGLGNAPARKMESNGGGGEWVHAAAGPVALVRSHGAQGLGRELAAKAVRDAPGARAPAQEQHEEVERAPATLADFAYQGGARGRVGAAGAARGRGRGEGPGSAMDRGRNMAPGAAPPAEVAESGAARACRNKEWSEKSGAEVMAAVKALVKGRYDEFRTNSAQFARGELEGVDYYTEFAEEFAMLEAEGLFAPMVALLPAAERRVELTALHRAHSQPRISASAPVQPPIQPGHHGRDASPPPVVERSSAAPGTAAGRGNATVEAARGGGGGGAVGASALAAMSSAGAGGGGENRGAGKKKKKGKGGGFGFEDKDDSAGKAKVIQVSRQEFYNSRRGAGGASEWDQMAAGSAQTTEDTQAAVEAFALRLAGL